MEKAERRAAAHAEVVAAAQRALVNVNMLLRQLPPEAVSALLQSVNTVMRKQMKAWKRQQR